MRIVEEARTTETPNARMDSLATPTLGSTELCAWRVSMVAGAQGPVHVVDREQVWMPLTGALAVTVDGETSVVAVGQSVIVPADEARQFRAHGGPVEAVVCMGVGGRASGTDRNASVPIPWAE